MAGYKAAPSSQLAELLLATSCCIACLPVLGSISLAISAVLQVKARNAILVQGLCMDGAEARCRVGVCITVYVQASHALAQGYEGALQLAGHSRGVCHGSVPGQHMQVGGVSTSFHYCSKCSIHTA